MSRQSFALAALALVAVILVVAVVSAIIVQGQSAGHTAAAMQGLSLQGSQSDPTDSRSGRPTAGVDCAASADASSRTSSQASGTGRHGAGVCAKMAHGGKCDNCPPDSPCRRQNSARR